MKLHADDTVKTIAQTVRKVPYHLQNKVNEKVKELEELDMFEKTDGQTDWVSLLIATPKKYGDKRIVIDMRRANETISREQNPIPTLDMSS